MENQIFELQYAIDTFYFLICGALVMWMAAGFSMLESGLVRAKNTTEILTKNVALYAIACFMYLASGYAIMYGGGWFLNGIEAFNLDEVLTASAENGFAGDSVYSGASDFFFQVVFVATAMSIVSGAVAERMKLWAFFVFAAAMTGFIYPMEGAWTWGGADVFGLFNLGDLGFSDFAGSGIVHMAGAAAALAGVLLLGARKGKYNRDGSANALPGANLPLATLGTFILWMGWFGFNGGSVLKLADAANAHSVAMVFLNTNAAAATGLIGALDFIERAEDMAARMRAIARRFPGHRTETETLAIPYLKDVRLALNVASTRVVLLEGHTGSQAGFRAFFYFQPLKQTAVILVFNTANQAAGEEARGAFDEMMRAAYAIADPLE